MMRDDEGKVLYRVVEGRAVWGFEAQRRSFEDAAVVTRTAPIGKWARGEFVHHVLMRLRLRGASVEKLADR